MNTKSGVSAATSANATRSAPCIFRLPLGPRLFSVFGVVAIGGIAVFMTAMAVLLLVAKSWGLAAFFTLLACFMAALTAYVGKDLHGKWGLRVVLEPDALVLDLPTGRSLIHHPPELHTRIPFNEIEAIETRQEVYVSQLMGMMQRAYVLHRNNGDLIFLFEDRAIGSQLEVNYFSKLVADIVARTHVPLRDLGIAAGKGGVLGVWGTHEPDWASPALSQARQKKLLRRVAITGALPIPLIMFAIILRLIVGG